MRSAVQEEGFSGIERLIGAKRLFRGGARQKIRSQVLFQGHLCVRMARPKAIYRPIAGGVCTIDRSKQNTTKTPRPAATIIERTSSSGPPPSNRVAIPGYHTFKGPGKSRRGRRRRRRASSAYPGASLIGARESSHRLGAAARPLRARGVQSRSAAGSIA